MQDGTGGCFPVGLNSLRLTSPCYFLVKPGILAACIAPHQYLSGTAISPPVCIHRTLRPNDSSSTCIGNGIFHPFHHHASWRTSNITSLPNHLSRKITKILVVPQCSSRYFKFFRPTDHSAVIALGSPCGQHTKSHPLLLFPGVLTATTTTLAWLKGMFDLLPLHFG